MKKKVIRLNENDIERIVNKIINEEGLNREGKTFYNFFSNKEDNIKLHKLYELFNGEPYTGRPAYFMEYFVELMEVENDIIVGRAFNTHEEGYGYGCNERGHCITLEPQTRESARILNQYLRNI
jgi:hypothetical protein